MGASDSPMSVGFESEKLFHKDHLAYRQAGPNPSLEDPEGVAIAEMEIS